MVKLELLIFASVLGCYLIITVHGANAVSLATALPFHHGLFLKQCMIPTFMLKSL